MKKKYIIALVFILGILSGVYLMNKTLYAPNVSTEKTYIDIPDKTDFDTLIQILSPYLKSKPSFKLASKIKRFSKPKTGRYLLKKGMSNNELINMLRIGKRLEVNVTFNNKNYLDDLAGAISRQIAPDSLSLLQAMRDKNFIRENGFTKDNTLLMYIPNTYRMYYNTGAKQFRKKMLDEYHKFWNDKRIALAKKQGLTPVEAGILASIIQKESTKTSELPRIAGVYLNRLKKGMLLQADPTVVYAYQQKHGRDLVIKRVLNKHKDIESPYNTYKHTGLPPGPICMPDIQSIKAVLHPEKHHYYYFVADFDKPGYHIFSKSLSEHNRHAQNYHTHLNRNKIYH